MYLFILFLQCPHINSRYRTNQHLNTYFRIKWNWHRVHKNKQKSSLISSEKAWLNWWDLILCCLCSHFLQTKEGKGVKCYCSELVAIYTHVALTLPRQKWLHKVWASNESGSETFQCFLKVNQFRRHWTKGGDVYCRVKDTFNETENIPNVQM